MSALLTAFYTMRQIAMTFLGEPRTEAAANATESVPTMTFPLIVLAVFAIFFGFTNVPPDFPVLGALFGPGGRLAEELRQRRSWSNCRRSRKRLLHFNAIPLLTSLVVALGGLGLGWLVYGAEALAGRPDRPGREAGRPVQIPASTAGTSTSCTAASSSTRCSGSRTTTRASLIRASLTASWRACTSRRRYRAAAFANSTAWSSPAAPT